MAYFNYFRDVIFFSYENDKPRNTYEQYFLVSFFYLLFYYCFINLPFLFIYIVAFLFIVQVNPNAFCSLGLLPLYNGLGHTGKLTVANPEVRVRVRLAAFNV